VSTCWGARAHEARLACRSAEAKHPNFNQKRAALGRNVHRHGATVSVPANLEELGVLEVIPELPGL